MNNNLFHKLIEDRQGKLLNIGILLHRPQKTGHAVPVPLLCINLRLQGGDFLFEGTLLLIRNSDGLGKKPYPVFIRGNSINYLLPLTILEYFVPFKSARQSVCSSYVTAIHELKMQMWSKGVS